MKDLLDRLSSYNFFNFLLPGVLFVVVVTHYTNTNLVHKEIAISFFIYYFIGLVVSRIGSLVVEPILIKIKLAQYSDYPDFIAASAKDDKINLLLEVNNTYRTLVSLFLCLALFKLFDLISNKYLFVAQAGPYALGLLLCLLFILSYGKQTTYINKRITAQVKDEPTSN